MLSLLTLLLFPPCIILPIRIDLEKFASRAALEERSYQLHEWLCEGEQRLEDANDTAGAAVKLEPAQELASFGFPLQYSARMKSTSVPRALLCAKWLLLALQNPSHVPL